MGSLVRLSAMSLSFLLCLRLSDLLHDRHGHGSRLGVALRVTHIPHGTITVQSGCPGQFIWTLQVQAPFTSHSLAHLLPYTTSFDPRRGRIFYEGTTTSHMHAGILTEVCPEYGTVQYGFPASYPMSPRSAWNGPWPPPNAHRLSRLSTLPSFPSFLSTPSPP